jgi:pentatricopeptide repeat protein
MEMIDSNNKGGDTALNIKPDTVTYCGVINCWSKSNRKEAPQRAFDILKIIISKYKEAQAHAAQTGNSYTNSNIIKPNTIAYNSVMDAYARQGDVDGATKVFNIMKEQQEQEVKFRTTPGSSSSSSMSSGFNSNTNTNKNKNTNAKPDIKSYTILINAWSKKSNSNNKEDDNAPLEAEALLFEIIDLYEKGDIEEGPNTITYGSVINCWSKSNRSDAPKRALKILKTMISKYNSNKEDNINNGNKNNNAVIPNTIAYSTVMDAYAKRGDVDGASNVFTMMKNDFRSGNKNAKPNRVTYSTMIDAWSKCSNNSKLNAPIEAEAVLLEMINLYSKGDIEGPGTTTYTSLINCWSKSSRPDAPKRSLQILKTMISNASNNQYVRPDTMTYNSIIDAHARQGDIDGAIEVFKMMTKDEDDINNDNNTINSVKPDLFTYNILIDCWYKSGSDNAPAQVEKILQEIKDRCKKGYLSQGPDEITYNTVIKCLESYTGTEDRVSELKKEQERTITAF